MSINSALPAVKENETSVSQLYTYGSFSGADIKVVAHLPKNPLIAKKMQQELNSIGGNIMVLSEEKMAVSNDQPTKSQRGRTVSAAQRATEIDEELNMLWNKYNDLDSELSTYNNLPTTKVLGELQTISYSVFREKAPVRTLGSVYPRGFVRGGRTIAGTMVFTIFHRHALHELLQELNLGMYNTGTSDHDKHHYSTNMVDQLPPIDLSLLFANEYGAISYMGIYGVEFVQEGATFSIEDIFSENVVQYVARDLDPMREAGFRKVDAHGVTDEYTKTASGLLYEKQDFNKELERRRNPYI
jgi:hypothetical protein